MAYLDDMATEREKTRAKMLEGKTPLLGEDTSRALHALGVSLGVVPAGAGPGQFEQLLASLVGPVKGVKVDDYKSPQYNPQSGTRAASGGGGGGYSGGGDGLSGLSDMMSKAKDSALKELLERKQRLEKQNAPGGSGGGGAHLTHMVTRGHTAEKARDQRIDQARTAIPGLKPDDSPGGVTSTAKAYMTEKTPGPGVTGYEKGGAGYKADLDYLSDHGGHMTVMKDGKKVDVRVDTPGNYGALDPELASRLRAAGEAYEKETGKKPVYSEFSRGDDVQKTYWEDSKHGTTYMAARPQSEGGKGSHHLTGNAGDLPGSEFRDWLYAGNQEKYGLRFPYAKDKPHIEVNPNYKGPSYAKPDTAPPPAWDKGLPKGADPKTAWADPSKATLPGSDRLELPSTTTASGSDAAITPQLMEAIKSIESSGNPNAVTKSGTYKGLYQLSDEQFAKYGGKGSIFDPAENTRVAKLIIADEAKNLSRELGRPVTASEIYMAHQQGFGGAAAHLKNPDQPAWQSMLSTQEGQSRGEGWARKAIWDNVPDDLKPKYGKVENITSKQFVEMWKQRGAERGITDTPSSTTAVSTAPSGGPEQGLYRDTVSGYQGAPGQAPAAPQTAPQNPQTAQIPPANQQPPPQITAPPPAPAQRAPASQPPPAPTAPAPQPQPQAPKGPTGVQKANAFLDMKAMDLIRRDSPENDTFITRQYVGDRTVRQMMGDPIASGKMKEGLPLAAKKYGFSPQDFDAAMHGKRADAGPDAGPAQTSDQLLAQAQGQTQPGVEPGKTQYAQADTGTMTDAGPGKPPAGSENLGAANQAMQLNPQEQALYQRHLDNLKSPGGVDNPDGSRSTLYASTFEIDGKTYVIPTVRDGKILSPDEALTRAKADGLDKFPSYASEAEADKRYQQLHDYMEKDTSSYLQSRGQPAQPQRLITERMPSQFAGLPSAPSTADYSSYQDFRQSQNVEDRTGEPGGGRRLMGIKAGIDQSRTPQWSYETALPEETAVPEANPLARELGINTLGGREKTSAAAYLERATQKLDRNKQLEIDYERDHPTPAPGSQSDEFSDGPPFAGTARAQPQGLTDFERAAGATLPPSGEPTRRTEARAASWAGIPATAPATATYDPYADFHRSDNVEDRRGAVGGARQALGIRAGIGREPATVAPWVDPDPGKNNQLARALGLDNVDPRGEAIRAEFIKREAQTAWRDKQLENMRPQTPVQTPVTDEEKIAWRDKQLEKMRASQAPPSLTPEMIKALQDVFKAEGVKEQGAPPPSPDSQPVLPSQVAPMPQAPPGGGGGGLSLAPSGLNTGPVQSPGAPASQGAPIAMAGLMPLPPIQDTAWTPPSTNLSPIPWDTVSDWGGGGGFGGFGAFGGF